MKIKGFEKSGAKYNQLLINVFLIFLFVFKWFICPPRTSIQNINTSRVSFLVDYYNLACFFFCFKKPEDTDFDSDQSKVGKQKYRKGAGGFKDEFRIQTRAERSEK
jgi:hypothetical protein